MSSGRYLLSTRKEKYAVVASDGAALLSREELRNIERFVDQRVVSATYASGAEPLPSYGIPPLPFEKVRERGDEIVGLAISSVDVRESALDVPLRFEVPTEYHAPVLVDAPSRVPPARRIAALIQGVSSSTVEWRRAAPVMKDANVAALQAAKDAESRAQAAMRSGRREKAAELYSVSGCFAYNCGNMELAATAFRKALAIAEATNDARGLAFCHNVLGVCYHRLGEYKIALIHHKKQEALGGDYASAVAETNMGVSYVALGELEFAQQAFDDAVLHARGTRDSMLLTIAFGNVGIAALRLGDMRSAQSHLEQCLEQCSFAGDKSGAALCLLLLGEVYALIHDHHHALFYYEHAFRVAGEAGNSEVVNVARVSIGIARGNAAIGDAMLAEAAVMGKKNSIQSVVNQLPQ